jgi:hypothetical protein
MKQFVFEQKQKTALFVMMAIGILTMILTYAGDNETHTRFWTNFLHNTMFFTGMAFAATFLIAAKTLAYSGWHTAFKRIWEAYALFLGVGLILLAIIVAAVWGGSIHFYHWTDLEAVAKDKILRSKASFLNKYWYAFAALGFVSVWYFFANKFRQLSLEQDASKFDINYPVYQKTKFFAAVFLPIAGFTSAAFIWQTIMSIDAHWYSTMFAWYSTASWVVSMIATTILMLIYLKSKGYFTWVTPEHLHDLGKYLFASLNTC